MRIVLKRGLVVVAALVFSCALAGGPAVAFAQEGDDAADDNTATTTSTGSDTETETHTGTNRGSNLKERLQELKDQRQERQDKRLASAKLKVCEARQKNIEHVMDRSEARAENQLKLFNTITERVEAFYVKKGKTVANYDELVANIATAKAKVQADVATMKGLTSFDCNGEDPKGDVEAFKTAHKAVIQDLKDYRTAVKNLIVAVKSAQGTESSEGSNQ
jgi:hypothetical protein